MRLIRSRFSWACRARDVVSYDLLTVPDIRVHPNCIEDSSSVVERQGAAVDDPSLIADVAPRLRAAQSALYTGDASAWRRLWLPGGRISWLGQLGTSAVGTTDVLAHFDRVASRAWAFEGFDLETLTVDVVGDHGYLVTRETPRVRIDGGPALPAARVSRVLRREHGTWFVAHGHADLDPVALELPWKPAAHERGADREP
ncbi:YybH family protein [Microbacterium sp. B2969]|uniref:YybH family protein n=1 Tax=Microbacterium alkaliflavum TaxID=3248839 RepID=A0ABW7QGZ4_9MICO